MDTSAMVDYCEKIWINSSGEFPEFKFCYTTSVQKERESQFSNYVEKFKKKQEELRKENNTRDTEGFFRSFRRFMKEIYDYSDEALSIILHPDMVQVSRSFFKQARAFDPHLKKEEIYQAMRNVWIMNGIQLLLGKKVEITPSMMAYSLLYPYSDNILDDPALSVMEKKTFSERFKKRLLGGFPMNDNYTENKISQLVAMIEEQYPRNLFPEVHGSLMAIHRAQTNSLRLNAEEGDLSEEEIRYISFDKGGCSVLADGYLVAGKLSPEIRLFFFGYGVWLQLADDIQDIREDLESDTRTLFSGENDQDKRITLTNKCFHFGRKVLNDIKVCDSEISVPFGKVILQSIELMMIQSAGMNNGCYPEKYSRELENYSPVGFEFLKEAKKKGTPGRLKLITQMMDQES